MDGQRKRGPVWWMLFWAFGIPTVAIGATAGTKALLPAGPVSDALSQVLAVLTMHYVMAVPPMLLLGVAVFFVASTISRRLRPTRTTIRRAMRR